MLDRVRQADRGDEVGELLRHFTALADGYVSQKVVGKISAECVEILYEENAEITVNAPEYCSAFCQTVSMTG